MTDKHEMDLASEQALADLNELKETSDFNAAANWWKKHYTATGHKRLARLLLKLAD